MLDTTAKEIINRFRRIVTIDIVLITDGVAGAC